MKGIFIMAMKNDDRILELKKQIEEKKKMLSEKKIRFVPETNCVIDIDGTKRNINVFSDDELKLLMIKLNLYSMSAKDLGIDVPEISGYPINSWITDIKNKLEVSELKKQESDLKQKEAKLEKMLSDDKKIELELDEIAKSLT